jgi:uncharacterized phage-associated protein
MSYSASLIAYAFVKKGIEEGRPLTQMKLQKMVYFAQGIHLALHKEPLVKDVFQAWKYGPVIPNIYHTYKYYGSSPIMDTDWILLSQFEEKALTTIDEKAKGTIDYTWDLLKDTNAIKLSNWTHEEGSPWQKSYVEGINDVDIPNGAIQTYFEGFLEK